MTKRGAARRCTCTGAGEKPRLADDILPQLTALAASAHPPHLASSPSAPSQGLWGQQSSEPPLFVCPISLVHALSSSQDPHSAVMQQLHVAHLCVHLS